VLCSYNCISQRDETCPLYRFDFIHWQLQDIFIYEICTQYIYTKLENSKSNYKCFNGRVVWSSGYPFHHPFCPGMKDSCQDFHYCTIITRWNKIC
jgi:hypothetical protein